jgi:hypothetical protein
MSVQEYAGALNFALDLSSLDGATAHHARAAGTVLGLGDAVVHGQAGLGEPRPDLASQFILRRGHCG